MHVQHEFRPQDTFRRLDVLYLLLLLSLVSLLLHYIDIYRQWRDDQIFGDYNPIINLPISDLAKILYLLRDKTQQLFILLFVALALIFYFYYLIKNITLITRHSDPITHSNYNKIVDKYVRQFKLNKPPVIYFTNDKTAPLPFVAWGLKNYLIIPRAFDKYFEKYPKEKEAIVAHEIAHIYHGDSWKTLIMQCLSGSLFVIGGFYALFDITAKLLDISWMRSNIILWSGKWFFLLSGTILITVLNLFILREREIKADFWAARLVNGAQLVKIALVRATGYLMTVSHQSHIKKSINLNIFSYHPSVNARNLYLSDDSFLFMPKPDLVFFSGLIAVLFSETIIRSFGWSFVYGGFVSKAQPILVFLVGLISFAPLFFPLQFRLIQNQKFPLKQILTTSILYSSIWGLGCFISGSMLTWTLEPLFFSISSVWSLVLFYLFTVPFWIFSTLAIASFVLWVTVKSPHQKPVYQSSIKKDNLIYKPKLAQSEYLQVFMNSSALFTVFILLVISAYFTIRHFVNLQSQAVNNRFANANTQPINEAPQGYTRFNDSTIAASLVYPKDWIAYRGASVTPIVEFINPSNYQSISVQYLLADEISTPKEYLALLTKAFQIDAERIAQPILLNTKIGDGTGYRLSFDNGSFIVQTAIISLEWNNPGVDYTFTSNCLPEDAFECKIYFDVMLENFDFISPSLGLTGETEDYRLYRDMENGFEFYYRPGWNIKNISSSLHPSRNSLYWIYFPDENLPWKQVVLNPELDFSENELIIIRNSSDSSSIDRLNAMNNWEAVQKKNTFLSEFEILGRDEQIFGTTPMLITFFQLVTLQNQQYRGMYFVAVHENQLWEIVALCHPDYIEECVTGVSSITTSIRGTR